jgi:regulator of sigma E protease
VLTNDVVVRQVDRQPAAGKLQPDDKVLSIDGVAGYQPGSATPRPTRARSACRRHQPPRVPGHGEAGCLAATPAKVVVERDGKQVTLLVTPKYDPVAKRMRIGFAYGPTSTSAGSRGGHHRREPVAHHAPDDVLDRAHLLRLEGAQGRLRRRRLLRDHAPVLPVRHHPGAQHPGHHLAVAGRGESLPLPAARWRPYLLGGGREDPRTSDSLPPDRTGIVVGFMLIAFLFVVGFTNDIDRLRGQGFNVR